MIRTVWLAAFCLAALAGLFASKVTASISPPTDDDITDPTTISAAAMPDTLTAADKVDLTGVRPAAEVAPGQPTDPVDIRPIKSARFHQLQRPGTKFKGITALPKPRPKSKLSKNGKTQSLAGDLKKCPETSSLAAFIMSLTSTSHCG